VKRANGSNQPGFGQDVPWPLQAFWPAQEALSPALQPLVPLQVFLPLQQSFAAGAAVSALGALAGAASAPPQPVITPTSIPETADAAKILPIFIFTPP
jgi:hypothetical protein